MEPFFTTETRVGVFESRRRFTQPDEAAYCGQKGVEIIQAQSVELADCVIIPGLEPFVACRLRAASDAVERPWTTRFPGHTLPGPAGSETYAGALEWERFRQLGKLAGIPAMAQSGPAKTVTLALADHWPWNIPEPELRVLTPPVCATIPWSEESWVRFERDLRIRLAHAFNDSGVSGLLLAVRQEWDPMAKPTWSEPTHLAQHFGQRVVEPSMAFELEAIASQSEFADRLNIHSRGMYRGMWLEVGELPLPTIKAAELVNTGRLLQELISIHSTGFAPLVVNELGMNTDGSHRHTASWLWNLLQSVVTNGQVQAHRVVSFVTEHQSAMGPIIVRECLRCLGEILATPELHRKIETDVFPRLASFRPVEKLPVVLLPEYSAGTMIKAGYDEGSEIQRVDPETYRILAANSAYTLPSRGPYHRTDRAMLPWFEVLQRR